MKDKKREEMPDILNDILGNKKPEQTKTKPDKIEDMSHNVKPSQQQDVMTSQRHKVKTQEPELPNEVVPEMKKNDDVTPLNSHDVIPLQRNDVIPSKSKIVKTTLYLSQELFDQLDEVWLTLRKKGYSKNDIVEIAIKKHLNSIRNEKENI
jgi:hypothetical protein